MKLGKIGMIPNKNGGKMEVKKYEAMNDLEKEVYNLKKNHQKLLEELIMVQNLQAKTNLSFEEKTSLDEYARSLRERYSQSLNIASEFEREFKVLGLTDELKTMVVNNENINKDALNPSEKLFLSALVAKVKEEHQTEANFKAIRAINNNKFFEDLDLKEKHHK